MRLFSYLPYILVLLLFSAPARAELEYWRLSNSKVRGTLTSANRKGEIFVSVRQFCFAFGCRVFYQWPNHRAIIQNSEEHIGAIVSSITHLVLVDGKVIDFDGEVLSDAGEGYFLPVDLAEKLAPALRLGRIEKHEDKKQKLAQKTDQANEFQVLVIDPGHGGNDLGTGISGIFEKDVAMIYAMKLKEELTREMPSLEIFLTREEDRYVSLPDRAKFANSKNANLFLSLHVNHAPNGRAEGVETYILSPEATDNEAKKVALLENDTWLKSAKISEAGNAVKKILIDMEQTKYIQNSALAASIIQQEMVPLDRSRGLKNRGVKQAMFYVLSQVAMPSTLVEMGFLSNTGDRSRLMDVIFRDEFVKSLVTALKRYKEGMKIKD